MPTYQLELVPRRSGSIVMTVTPLFIMRKPVGMTVGRGDTDYICGVCKIILLASSDGGVVIERMVIECGICGAHNFVRGKHRPQWNGFKPGPILPNEYAINPLLREIRLITRQL